MESITAVTPWEGSAWEAMNRPAWAKVMLDVRVGPTIQLTPSRLYSWVNWLPVRLTRIPNTPPLQGLFWIVENSMFCRLPLAKHGCEQLELAAVVGEVKARPVVAVLFEDQTFSGRVPVQGAGEDRLQGDVFVFDGLGHARTVEHQPRSAGHPGGDRQFQGAFARVSRQHAQLRAAPRDR